MSSTKPGPDQIKNKGDKVVQTMTTIGWVLFGLSVVLMPFWIVLFIYLILFGIVVAAFYILKEYLNKSMSKSPGKSTQPPGSGDEKNPPPQSKP